MTIPYKMYPAKYLRQWICRDFILKVTPVIFHQIINMLVWEVKWEQVKGLTFTDLGLKRRITKELKAQLTQVN